MCILECLDGVHNNNGQVTHDEIDEEAMILREHRMYRDTFNLKSNIVSILFVNLLCIYIYRC